MPEAAPLVRLTGIVHRYAEGAGERTVLDGLDFSVAPGEMVALLGAAARASPPS